MNLSITKNLKDAETSSKLDITNEQSNDHVIWYEAQPSTLSWIRCSGTWFFHRISDAISVHGKEKSEDKWCINYIQLKEVLKETRTGRGKRGKINTEQRSETQGIKRGEQLKNYLWKMQNRSKKLATKLNWASSFWRSHTINIPSDKFQHFKRFVHHSKESDWGFCIKESWGSGEIRHKTRPEIPKILSFINGVTTV